MEDIIAVPNSSILIVNREHIVSCIYEQQAIKCFTQKDNISIYTVGNYKEATQIIDKIKINILITSFHFFAENKTGLDLCQYMKQRNSRSVCTLIAPTFIDQSDANRFCDKNRDYIDFAYDASIFENHGKIFPRAFESLKEKLATERIITGITTF